MSPESQIIAQAQHEYNAGALAARYRLMEQQLAFMGGIVIAEVTRPTMSEVQQVEEQELKKQEHYARQNIGFIESSFRLLPVPERRVFSPGEKERTRFKHPRTGERIIRTVPSKKVSKANAFEIENKPENHLRVHALLDRIVWLEIPIKHEYTHRNFNHRDPAYVIGTNPKRGLLTVSYTSNLPTIGEHTSRKARKLASQYANIFSDPDPSNITKLYKKESNTFVISPTDSGITVLGARQSRKLDKLDDADMHDYGVVGHLMHLTAMFDVQHEWAEILRRHTQDAPQGEVAQLKELLETQFGKQPELPPQPKSEIKQEPELPFERKILRDEFMARILRRNLQRER